MQYKPELHSERGVEEYFNVICTRNPYACAFVTYGFVSFWYMQITPSQTWSLTHLVLSGQLTALVCPIFLFTTVHPSGIFLGYPYYLLLGELRPILGPSLRDLRYIKQRGWLGEEKIVIQMVGS